MFVAATTRSIVRRTALSSSTLRALSLLPQNINTVSTRYQSWTTNKSSGIGTSDPLQHSQVYSFSSVSVFPMKEENTAHKTVQELLDIFETSKESLETEDCIELLRKLARAVWHDEKQRLELQKIRAASAEGCSMFRQLLNHIADSTGDSNVDDKQVSTILWSLEKIGENNHRLYRRFDRGKIILIKER